MTATTNLPLGASLNGTSFTIVNSASLLNGDYRLLFAECANTTIAPPAGWATELDAVVATSRRVYVFSDTHDSANPAGTAFTLAATNNYGYFQVAIRDHDTTAPMDATPLAASDSATTSQTVIAPSITPVDADTLLLTFHFQFSNSTLAALSTPTGMTLVGGQVGNGTNGHSVKLFKETRAAAGATGTRTSTATLAAPNGGVSVVIAPAGLRNKEADFMPFFS